MTVTATLGAARTIAGRIHCHNVHVTGSYLRRFTVYLPETGSTLYYPAYSRAGQALSANANRERTWLADAVEAATGRRVFSFVRV